MSVTATHPDYRKHVARWELVRNLINSEVEEYIHDVDPNDPNRNDRYKDDARLTNFTARTKHGLVGAAFRQAPVIDLPEAVDYLETDATGGQLPLVKLAQEVLGEVLQAGRYGLLVDYPASEEGLTKAQEDERNNKARINKYKAENITNWQHQIMDGEIKLTLVVLKEFSARIGEDGFTWEQSIQYRVLRLVEGVYTQELYDEKSNLLSQYIPRDFVGQSWNMIPFVFVGSEDNDSEMDPSPMYDLAQLNIGHLRNSADYEESVHITGQPTLIISTEMSSEEFKDSNPSGVLIGARKGHNLGAGGSAMLLQANPNQLADEAMRRKEEQAVMIGARLITPQGLNETAEGMRIKHSGENSVLATISDNVADAMNRCIGWVIKFMSADIDAEYTFDMNKQFFEVSADPQLIVAQLQLFNNGIIAASDVRSTLRKSGVIAEDRTDEEIESEAELVNPITGAPDNGDDTDFFD